MKTDYLKELGLEQDVIDKVMAENGKDIEAIKAQLGTLTSEKESLLTQIADANKQIEAFKGMDVDGIKAAADEYKAKYEAAEAKAKAEIEALQFRYKLDTALTGAKAREPKAVAALLNMDGLKLVDGEIVGLKEQLEKLKAEKDFLFESDQPAPQIVKGTGGAVPTGDDAAIRAIMGLPPKK